MTYVLYILHLIVELIVSAVVLLCTATAVTVAILACLLWKIKKMKIQEKEFKEMLTLDVSYLSAFHVSSIS